MKLNSSVALVAGLFFVNAAQAANLKADYQFNDTLASSVGASNAEAIGTASYATENVNGVNERVYTFNPNDTSPNNNTSEGLRVDTTGVISSTNYSAVFTARLDTDSGLLSKILDFKNRTSDAGLYISAGLPVFYDGLIPVNPGPTVLTPVAGGTLPVPDNAYASYAFTRDAAGQVRVYVNGAESFNFTDTSNLATIATFLTFFADDGITATVPLGITNVESPNGAVARIQLFDGALTAAEVAALVPEPTSLAMIALAGPSVVRRRR